MKICVLYDKKQDKILAEMQTYFPDKGMVFGAIPLPCNHHKMVVLAGSLSDMQKYWRWMRESEYVSISDEYPFDEKDIEIKELNIASNS